MNTHLHRVVLFTVTACAANRAHARGFPPNWYDAPGFSIPDNNPLGASSSVHAFPIEAIAVMDVWVYFPASTAAGGHTWSGDLTATLTLTPDAGGPMLSADLFRRIGANSAGSRGDSSDFVSGYRFIQGESDPDIWTAAALVGPENRIPGFTYRPSSRSADFQYQYVSFVNAFGVNAPAGTWTLNISDHSPGDTGRILGWRIEPFIPKPASAALLALIGASSLRRVRH